jgi:hypothetical protein
MQQRPEKNKQYDGDGQGEDYRAVYWKEWLEACYAVADKKQHRARALDQANGAMKYNSQMILWVFQKMHVRHELSIESPHSTMRCF